VSVQQLPSGEWRAQVYDPATRKNVSVSKVLGRPGTFPTKTAAKQARARAREKLAEQRHARVTVQGFYERWTTDPLFARPKESTEIRRRERTRGFVECHAELALSDIDARIVGEWLAGGKRNHTVPGLRAMFNDAASGKAGRLIHHNPFAKLGLEGSTGNRDLQPPSEDEVWAIISHARRLVSPDYAAWLQVACFTGLRPGELDALRWPRIDFERSRILVLEQFNSTTRTFTSPKNGLTREAPLTDPARAALLSLPQDGDFCFRSLRGTHWSPSSRSYGWKAVRAAAGWKHTLYLATRHFAGWYMTNILELRSEDVAITLGHRDGGQLVRRLYGHRDKDRALDRVTAAYEKAGRAESSWPVQRGSS
jgi:integrase